MFPKSNLKFALYKKRVFSFFLILVFILGNFSIFDLKTNTASAASDYIFLENVDAPINNEDATWNDYEFDLLTGGIYEFTLTYNTDDGMETNLYCDFEGYPENSRQFRVKQYHGIWPFILTKDLKFEVPLKKGRCRLKLYEPNVLYDGITCKVYHIRVALKTPLKPVSSVNITAPDNRDFLYPYEPIQLNAQVFPQDATYKDVTWEVYKDGQTGSADLTKDGLLTPNGSGKMFAIATSTDGYGKRAFYEFKIGYQREAEDYTDTTNNLHEGYTGSGYADIASTVEFPISPDHNFPGPGLYELSLCYANGSDEDAVYTIRDNSDDIKKTTLPPTGSWENWAYKTEYIQINNGSQLIDYYVKGDDNGGAILDHLRIVYLGEYRPVERVDFFAQEMDGTVLHGLPDTLSVNHSYRVTAITRPDNATVQDFVWQVTDEYGYETNRAEINPTSENECIIKGVKPGLVKLRATNRDGKGVYDDATFIVQDIIEAEDETKVEIIKGERNQHGSVYDVSDFIRGNELEFVCTYNAPIAGVYDFDLRYFLYTTGIDMPFDIFVNDQAEPIEYVFPKREWNDYWKNNIVRLTLDEGINTIRYYSYFGPYIDYLGFTLVETSDVWALQAEHANIAQGSVKNSVRGYYGDGYVEERADMTFNLSDMQEGYYGLSVRYSASQGYAATYSLYINDNKSKQITLPMPKENIERYMWIDKTELIHLDNGLNTITIKKDGEDNGDALIDSIKLFKAYPVNTIDVTSAGDIPYMSVGTELQMSARVLPEYTFFKDVVWSVINPDGTTCYTASIDENGLLKSNGTGQVKVIATSTDNRRITGEKIITMHQRYEAEDADFSGANMNNVHGGFSGTGYLETKANIDFTISEISSGYYDLSIRYSAERLPVATYSLYVGDKRIKQLNLSNTESWNKWAVVTERIPIGAPVNKISIKRDAGDNGDANIDFLAVCPSGPLTLATDIIVSVEGSSFLCWKGKLCSCQPMFCLKTCPLRMLSGRLKI
jgi:hypothetical protein